MAFISNGVLPSHTSLSKPYDFGPFESQPLLVCPTNNEPSIPQHNRSTPDSNPPLKKKAAPWYWPFTSSKKTRLIKLWLWSPTNICPAYGPNLLSSGICKKPDMELPMI